MWLKGWGWDNHCCVLLTFNVVFVPPNCLRSGSVWNCDSWSLCPWSAFERIRDGSYLHPICEVSVFAHSAAWTRKLCSCSVNCCRLWDKGPVGWDLVNAFLQQPGMRDIGTLTAIKIAHQKIKYSHHINRFGGENFSWIIQNHNVCRCYDGLMPVRLFQPICGCPQMLFYQTGVRD